MLEVVNRYAHGFVAVPVIEACRAHGLFALWQEREALSLQRIGEALGANSGHLLAALRMLAGLGWIRGNASQQYELTEKAALVKAIPENIRELFDFSMEAYVSSEPDTGSLGGWITLSENRWNTSDPVLADLLDGVLIVPVLLAAQRLGLFTSADDQEPLLRLHHVVREELTRLFTGKGWMQGEDAELALTAAGRYLVDRALVLGTTASYKPMLSRVGDLIFGAAASVMYRSQSGHERHLDRALNVIASGFQHERYFRDVDEIILDIFNGTPIDQQPACIADMGCGDGSFLKRVYNTVCERTVRGKHLEEFPLQLVGVDYNKQALIEAERQLSFLPHLLIEGDIGDPRSLILNLASLGIRDPTKVMHIRSFLDHDRPYRPPVEMDQAAARYAPTEVGVFVDESGAAIPPGLVVQNLVEHLRRWSLVVGPHGLLVLEVHCLPPQIVGQFLDKNESLHFDAYHAFSGQLLVPACVFLLSAAEAGLFPRVKYSRRYPATLPYARITLSWFEKRDYTVRLANNNDIPHLLELENACWPEGFRTPEREIRRRVATIPGGQCMLELDRRLAAVAYMQRIGSREALAGISFDELASVHQPEGPIVQLLGMNVHPDFQQRGLGDQFLEFILVWLGAQSGVERVLGITRCRDFANQSRPLSEYVHARDRQGFLLDPILRFHEAHGAVIKNLMPGYRKDDQANNGAGVLIEYDLLRSRTEGAPEEKRQDHPQSGVLEEDQLTQIVESSVRRVLGPRRRGAFDKTRPLMEMGLDSLDLMELKSELEVMLKAKLEPTFFFEHSTPQAVVEFLRRERQARAPGQVSGPGWQPSVSSQRPENYPAGPHAVKAAQHVTEVNAADQETMAECIAIVGMACRFPGRINDPSAFWSLLCNGGDAITEISAVRESLWGQHRADRQIREYPWIRYGGFLEGVDGFDHSFFHIAPREVMFTDPQQRILLEVTWEALEHAGVDPSRLAGTRTGVFTGIFSHDYELLQVRDLPGDYFDVYSATGGSSSLAAGRIAYFLGLHGPAVSVDTACSSSLVAVHLACVSLRNGECDAALATGVNLILAPDLSIVFAKSGMLAPDGRCKTFDASANGYVRGEGCAAVVLKRLADAIAGNDRILAVIRGSAMNQDGASNGLTAPNISAQEALLRQTLRVSSVHASQVSYIETHGTGTSLGDPVEVDALGRVFRGARSTKHPLLMGAVKANLGHLEAAAGLAGLIKVVLCLEHGELVSQVHFHRPNPHVAWKDLPIEVCARRHPWQPIDGRRIAGVSSFGFSGSNAHVVLEGWREAAGGGPRAGGPRYERPWHLLPLSAKSPEALRALAMRYHDFLQEHPEVALGDVAFTAATGRAHFRHRLSVAGRSPEEARQALGAWLEGRTGGEYQGEAGRGALKVAFLFPGQGAQYPGMGRELYQTQGVFRAALERCSRILEEQLPVPLLSVLYGEEGQGRALLDQTAYTQPALFAVQYGLYELWRSFGIEPTALLGHSVGEYVAACAAGVFSLEQGLGLLATRARLMQSQPAGGAMAAVLAGAEQVQPLLVSQGPGVSLAAINGPSHTVISGAVSALGAVCRELEAEGRVVHRLNVSHAFHSPLMEPVLEEFERAAEAVSYQPPVLPLISNVSGTWAGREVTEAGYWRRHLRQPVQFAAGMGALAARGCEAYVEVGPQRVLSGLGRRCVDGEGVAWLASLLPHRSDWEVLVETLAALYGRGADIDWSGVEQGFGHRKLALPTYPFQRQRFWYTDERSSISPVSEQHHSTAHPLLGNRRCSPLDEAQFESALSAARPPYLGDHRVWQRAILPAAAYIEMLLAAAREVYGSDQVLVRSLLFQRPMWLSEELQNVQVIVRRPHDGEAVAEVYSLQDADERQPAWRLHACGQIIVDHTTKDGANEFFEETLLAPQSVEELQERCRGWGIEHGPRFAVLDELRTGDGQAAGRLRMPESLCEEAGGYQVHPALLDGCFRLALALQDHDETQTYLPASVDELRFYRRPKGHLWGRARLRATATGRPSDVDLNLRDETGALIAEIRGLALKPASRELFQGAGRPLWADWLYQVEWRAQPRPASAARAAGLPEPDELSQRLQPSLQSAAGELRQRRVLEQLERLSRDFVLRAFDQLGWKWRRGDSLEATELADRLGVVPSQRRLFGRLLEILAEEGSLRNTEDRWEVLKIPVAADPLREAQGLLEGQTEAKNEIILLSRCGADLAAVLRGRQNPLELLFPSGDMSVVGELYRDAPTFRVMNRLVGQAFDALLSGLPPSLKLRVLEIGAGTGGTTSLVLTHVSGGTCDYVFTDVSSLFITRAREEFKGLEFVRCQRLDIERDPRTQGFAEGSFDLILAANVLHATARLKTTLAHIHWLLAPGGQLLLVEGSERRRWIDLTFGLLEGWWKFADSELRSSYPLLTAPDWERLLRQEGFSQTAAWSPQLRDEQALFRQALIVAQKAPTVIEPCSSGVGCWLVLADGHGLGSQLAHELRKAGYQTSLAFAGEGNQQLGEDCFQVDPCQASGFEPLLRAAPSQGPLLGVIDLWTVEAADAHWQSGEQLAEEAHPGWGSLLALVQALVRVGPTTRVALWIVTRGTQPIEGELSDAGLLNSPVWGLTQVIALEHPELRCGRVDLDPVPHPDEAARLCETICRPDDEDQVGFRHGKRYVARLAQPPVKAAPTRHFSAPEPFRLQIRQRGTLDGLEWVRAERRRPGRGEIEIRVQACGVNFLDVLDALGVLPFTRSEGLGIECAGEVLRVGQEVDGFAVGDRVMAFAAGSLGQYVTVSARLAARLPESISYEESATVPVAFSTAWHALHDVARIRPGQKVLIHAAAGGTGMAAVQVARRAGAEVIATASPGKWDAVRALGVTQVLNSRTLDYSDQVLQLTAGLGVDIVLNSLAGQHIEASLRALAAEGHFLELGKTGIWPAERVAQLKPHAAYTLIDLQELCRSRPEQIQALLIHLRELFRQGQLSPLPRTVFSLADARKALRTMQQARHIGKIVITPSVDESTTAPSVPVGSQGTYLVTGALGGLGLRVALWLVEHGAENLVLVGRRGATDETRLDPLREAGARLLVVAADVSKRGQLAAVLEKIPSSWPPLRGVVHAAGVLDDGLLSEQTEERVAAVLAPKLKGAWNLHLLTEDLELDFWLMFSSTAALLGSAGQANHAAANAFLDTLVHWRRRRGLPAQSINWGAWAQIGAAATEQVQKRMHSKGINVMAPPQALDAMTYVLANQDIAQVGVVSLNWPVLLGSRSPTPFFTNFMTTSPASNGLEPSSLPWLTAAPETERLGLVVRSVREAVASVLGMDKPERVRVDQGFFHLGMDSLTSVELRNRLQARLGVSLPATLAFDYPTVEKLAGYVLTQIMAGEDGSGMESAPAASDREDRDEELDDVSVKEAAELLEQELDELEHA